MKGQDWQAPLLDIFKYFNVFKTATRRGGAHDLQVIFQFFKKFRTMILEGIFLKFREAFLQVIMWKSHRPTPKTNLSIFMADTSIYLYLSIKTSLAIFTLIISYKMEIPAD